MVAMTLAACSLLCVSARAAVSATQRKLVVTGWATYTALIALAALLSSFAEARPLDALPLAIAGLSGAIATRWTLRQCHRRRKSIFENYLSQ